MAPTSKSSEWTDSSLASSVEGPFLVSAPVRALVLAALALSLAAPRAAQSQRPTPKPPPGTKVVSGRHFDVYVQKTGERPTGTAGFTFKSFQVVTVATTRTHGTQRITRRVEAINSDLLDAANWQIIDLDQDGFDDYRYVAEIGTNGCHTWDAERWEPDHDRFTGAPKYVRWTDAQGKVLSKSCAGT